MKTEGLGKKLKKGKRRNSLNASVRVKNWSILIFMRKKKFKFFLFFFSRCGSTLLGTGGRGIIEIYNIYPCSRDVLSCLFHIMMIQNNLLTYELKLWIYLPHITDKKICLREFLHSLRICIIVLFLQVIKALTSLKSRGYVKEQFAWRHFYWYLTNEGTPCSSAEKKNLKP